MIPELRQGPCHEDRMNRPRAQHLDEDHPEDALSTMRLLSDLLQKGLPEKAGLFKQNRNAKLGPRVKKTGDTGQIEFTNKRIFHKVNVL